ncbi:MAG: zinc ribbon domain-containing protein [Candidatus Woesearchaeota archaeon]|jgi:hypothetical protein|nr:zinc ribbon domain-containing protein [Candidatus Woesearchaeota archaeon]
MSESRRERYEKAKKAREQAKATENSNFDMPDLEKIEYLPLRKDKFEVFRIISNQMSLAQTGFDATKIKHSMLRGDDQKFFNVVWSYDRDWPMNKLYYFMTSGVWDSESKSKTYDKKGCDLLNEILSCGSESPYASGWRPSELALMNVIDRLDYEWHKENKKLKVATKDAQRSDKGFYYTSYGISKNGIYENILTQCEDNMVYCCDTDIAIRRLTKGTVGKDGNWYKIFLPEFEANKMEKYSEEDDFDYMSYVSNKELTDEEKSWDGVDFRTDPRYKVTSTIKIYNRLKKFIAKVDKNYGENFTEMFEEQVAQEKAEFKAMREEQEKRKPSLPSKKENPVEESVSKPEETPVQEEKVSRTRKAKVEPEEEMEEEFSEDMIPEKYLGYYEKLPDEEKDLINGFDMATDEFTFIEGETTLDCPECGKYASENVTSCPYCGVEFDD